MKENEQEQLAKAFRKAARLTNCMVHQISIIFEKTKKQKNRQDRKKWKNKFRHF